MKELKTILKESLFKQHITHIDNYIEPYNKQITIDDLHDGDYFAIEWKPAQAADTLRACGIFYRLEEKTFGQLSAICYCAINANGKEYIYNRDTYCMLGLREGNKILPITKKEYKKLSELYEEYKRRYK